MINKEFSPATQQFLPDPEELFNEIHLHEFFRTMFERQEIWWKRNVLEQPRPWTIDPYFRDFKFTNVYRELDRNSQYEINNAILSGGDFLDKMWKIAFFRSFNNPELFEVMGGLPNHDSFSKEKLWRAVKEIRKQGKNPFTSAYCTNSVICPNQTRDWCFVEKVNPTIHESLVTICEKIVKKKYAKPLDFVKDLLKWPSVSYFMAHEFYVSFCYISKYSNQNDFPWDENSWTNVGPGASAGIYLIFPFLKGKKKEEGMKMLKKIAPSFIEEHFPDFKFIRYDKSKSDYVVSLECNLTLHQIEMWLCEYSKYFKMKVNQGKQRSKFQPNKDSNYFLFNN